MQVQSYPPPIEGIVEAHQELEEDSISLQEENSLDHQGRSKSITITEDRQVISHAIKQ
jgi:hypothetical protein